MTLTRMRVRDPRAALAACAAVGAALLTACGSGGSGTPDARPTYTDPQYIITIVQCTIDRGLIPDKDWKTDATAHHWFVNGHIVGNFDFAKWWLYSKGLVIDGETLDAWTWIAYTKQRLPAQICGTTVMPTPVPS